MFWNKSCACSWTALCQSVADVKWPDTAGCAVVVKETTKAQARAAARGVMQSVCDCQFALAVSKSLGTALVLLFQEPKYGSFSPYSSFLWLIKPRVTATCNVPPTGLKPGTHYPHVTWAHIKRTFYFQLLPYPFPCVGSHMLICIIWWLGVI